MADKWTSNQQQQAETQGWGVFALDGDQTRLAIQRLDEADVFADDGAALAFVEKAASGGDSLCQTALVITGNLFEGCQVQLLHPPSELAFLKGETGEVTMMGSNYCYVRLPGGQVFFFERSEVEPVLPATTDQAN